jgi:ribosomal protein L21
VEKKKYVIFALLKKINMFGILDIAGQQFKAKQNDTLFVHRLQGNVGDVVDAKVL